MSTVTGDTPTASSPILIRPTTAPKRRPIPAMIVALGVVSLFQLLRYDWPARIAMASFIAAVTAVGLVLSHRWVAEASLSADADGVTYRGVFGARTIAATTIARIVVATVRWPNTDTRYEQWLLVDAADRALLSLEKHRWGDEDMQRLAHALRLRQEVDPEPRSPRMVRERYPGGLPWIYAHAIATTGLLIVGAAILIAVFQTA